MDGDEPAVRVPFVDVDDDAGFVAEGDDIDEAATDSSEVVINTGKVAVLVKVSREQYGTGSAASMLSDATRRALIRKANVAYLSQVAPTPPATTPPAGLLNLSPTDGGLVSGNLDAVSDAFHALALPRRKTVTSGTTSSSTKFSANSDCADTPQQPRSSSSTDRGQRSSGTGPAHGSGETSGRAKHTCPPSFFDYASPSRFAARSRSVG